MNEDEAEVSSIEYVGPHSTRPDLFEVVLKLKAKAGARQTRLCLLFAPAEAAHLAKMLEANPPRAKAGDHLAGDIERLQT
jgi:hypothetical protein